MLLQEVRWLPIGSWGEPLLLVVLALMRKVHRQSRGMKRVYGGTFWGRAENLERRWRRRLFSGAHSRTLDDRRHAECTHQSRSLSICRELVRVPREGARRVVCLRWGIKSLQRPTGRENERCFQLRCSKVPSCRCEITSWCGRANKSSAQFPLILSRWSSRMASEAPTIVASFTNPCMRRGGEPVFFTTMLWIGPNLVHKTNEESTPPSENNADMRFLGHVHRWKTSLSSVVVVPTARLAITTNCDARAYPPALLVLDDRWPKGRDLLWTLAKLT